MSTYSSVKKEFGKRVKKYRVKEGLTQEKLAFASGLHSNYIGRLERGEVNPSLVTILLIAKALNVSTIELVKGIKLGALVK